MLRKHTAILAIATLLTTGAAAQAETPTSQFGFKGWPYRNQQSCGGSTGGSVTSPTATPLPTTIVTAAPTQGAQKPCKPGQNAGNSDCVSTSAPCTPTATTNCDTGIVCTPSPGSGSCPTAEATQQPTARPTAQVTAVPTAAPTAVPTAVPTTAPTTVPTSAPTTAPTAAPTKVPSMDEDYTTDSVTAQEQNAVNLLNADRGANGLGSLTLDPALCAIARKKSEDMRDNNYFAHNSPTYGSASDMLKTFGYSFKSVGENIAHHATVAKAQAAFMSSDGHRRNILGTSWTKVGVGVCTDRNGYVYVTQLFVR